MFIIILLAMITGKAEKISGFESDTFRTANGKNGVITFIKHGSLLIEYEGKYLYVDPVSDYADFTLFPKADVILITHEHGDHLDIKAIAALEKNDTRLILNKASQVKLNKGTVMKNGDELSPVEWLHLKAVPAYNTTPGREGFHPKNRDNGYVLTLGGTRIYIAGDTEDIPEMKELKDIDIAFLPVNQPYTMTVDQAVHATLLFHPHILYPYHYGETDIWTLKQKLPGISGTEVRIRQLQ